MAVHVDGTHAAFVARAMHSIAYEFARCPVCNGADSHEIAGADEVREEIEALWAFHTRRLRDDTPPDRLTDRLAFSQPPPLRLVQCARCETVFRNPRERAFEVIETYADETPSLETLQSLHDTQRATFERAGSRDSRTVAGRPGRGLEIGSYAAGFSTPRARPDGISRGSTSTSRRTNSLRSLGFPVTSGDLVSFRTRSRSTPSRSGIASTSSPTRGQPARAAHGLLKPNGVLAIRVPNGGFYATVRRRLDGIAGPVARALLAHNNLLAFPYRHGFTVRSLTLLLEDTGFEVVRTHGDALVPIADEWTRGWAAAEERMIKTVIKALAALDTDGAPWFEIYARRDAR